MDEECLHCHRIYVGDAHFCDYCYSEASERLDKLEAEVESLKAQLAAKERECERLQGENEEFLGEKDSQGRKIFDLKTQIDRLGAEVERLTREATCPCCITGKGTGINIEGQVCPECHGTTSIQVAYNSARIYVKRQEEEVGRLKAELEKRKLKWQRGRIPCPGNYLYKTREGWAYCMHLDSAGETSWEWAGPIESPEPAPDKG